MTEAFDRRLRSALFALFLGLSSPWASAHGDEPHGDEPHPVAASASATPGFEAASDAFELVARLQGDSLTLFIHRYESGEPVLQADVEIESSGIKARASYQADPGIYVVRDEGLLQALSRPGTHPLIVTLLAGDDADLLQGALTVAAAQQAQANEDPAPIALLALLAVGAGGTLAPGAWYLRGRLETRRKAGAR